MHTRLGLARRNPPAGRMVTAPAAVSFETVSAETDSAKTDPAETPSAFMAEDEILKGILASFEEGTGIHFMTEQEGEVRKILSIAQE